MIRTMQRLIPGLFFLWTIGAAVALAAERVAGPVEADLVRIVDGDTIEVRALVWPGIEVTVGARIRGIDTPELRAQCREEAILAAAATDRLRDALGGGKVRLANIEHDKFAGRVVADVTNGEGVSVAQTMIASGLARAYDGGGRAPWCDPAMPEVEPFS
jgi:micrococcal nuclease